MTKSPASRVRVLRIIARMNIGGPAYHVSVLSGRLDRDRYETVLLTGSLGTGEGSFEGLAQRYGAMRRTVPGLRPEVAPLSDLRALVSLMRTIKQFRPDVVHTHTAKAGALGRLAAILTPGVRPLIVHTFHGHGLSGYFGARTTATYRGIERLLARASDCLIGVSPATVEELIALGVAPRRKFRAIGIGLDLDHLLSVERGDGASFRAELGIREDELLAVFVGRLVPIKRVDVLIEAISLVRASGQRVRLAIVGDGELRETLERQARGLGMANDAVAFVGFREDLPAIAAGTDIAVLSSDNEGTPVALIEASAAARPAIATAVGGVGEIVTPATGMLVPAGDPAAFAEALSKLARDPEIRAQMGIAAREHVRKRFSAKRLLGDIDELYRELQAERDGAAG